MIPGFQRSGTLPPGRHRASWAEFSRRFGTNERRRKLLAGLRKALEDLRVAGCRRIFVDGSFVTVKELPEDFDVCWAIEGVDPKRLAPVLLQFGHGRAAQKAKYLGELLPANLMAGSRDTFLQFFQRDRDGHRKGIIVLDLRRLP